MEYRQLGTSDVKVSVVTFGAWAIGGWMWGKQDEQDAIAAIKCAIGLGMTAIDTAAIYGYGRSEELVGQAVAGRRDKVQILTKYGLRWDCRDGVFHFDWPDEKGVKVRIYKNARRKSVLHECEQSLRRLKTDYIDLYQCHWRDPSTPLEETMGAMDKLLKDGKIRAAGVSNFTVEDIVTAAKIVPLASDQPPYSMINRDIEKDVLPYCREHKIGVIPYSPLQRGLLADKFKPGHKFAPGDHRAGNPFFKDANIRRINMLLDGLRPIAEEHKATLAQVAINWTIQRPGVTAALVGARNPAQAEQNAAAANFKLSDAETEQIDAMLDELKLEL